MIPPANVGTMNKPEKKTFEPVYELDAILDYIRVKYSFDWRKVDRYRDYLMDGVAGNGCFHYVGIGEDINPDIIEAAIIEEFGPIEKVWVEW